MLESEWSGHITLKNNSRREKSKQGGIKLQTKRFGNFALWSYELFFFLLHIMNPDDCIKFSLPKFYSKPHAIGSDNGHCFRGFSVVNSVQCLPYNVHTHGVRTIWMKRNFIFLLVFSLEIFLKNLKRCLKCCLNGRGRSLTICVGIF